MSLEQQLLNELNQQSNGGASGPQVQRADEPLPPVGAPYEFNFRDVSGTFALDPYQGGWIEHIGNEAPATYETSPKFANATLYAYIPNNADIIYRFENAVLGWHVTNSDFSRIRRTNPIQHPKKANLWAYKISEAKGIKFVGTDGPNSIPGISRISSVGSQSIESHLPRNGPNIYAAYYMTLVAVDFKPISYLMPDEREIVYVDPYTQVTTYLEQFRYVEYDTKTNIYDVTIQTGQFTFTEGPDANPQGKVFPGEINFLEVKQTYNLHWRQVPEDCVFDTVNYGLGRPWKLQAAAGCVNSVPFMGYPAGTLLLIDSDIDRYQSGSLRAKQAPLTPGNTALVDKPFMMCDVMLSIVHFDPPHFSENNRGHNLKPWRRDTSTVPSQVLPWQFWRPESVPAWLQQPPAPPVAPEPRMLYYLVKYKTAAGQVTETRIYGSYDFNKIFQHWSLK